MKDVLETSSYFGLALSLIIYFFSYKVSQKFKITIFSPILLSGVVIIIILLLGDISYETYEASSHLLSKMLAPAIVCYGLPLYRQRHILKEHFSTILISIMAGCLASLGSVYIFSRLFQFDTLFFYSLIPKSVTTAIGISITEELGGITAITIASILFSGMIGSAIAVRICRMFRIHNAMAKGLAIGTASHVIGTTKAVELGEVEGAMSSLALVIAGILTVILISFINL